MLNNRGFTLIELLIVVMFIGILAGISILKFGSNKEKAYVASMKSDLHNLVNAEEGYFVDFTTYTTSLATTQFNSSAGVTVSIDNATGTGWHATATHSATATKCRVYLGDAGGGSTAGDEGKPQCQ